MESAGEGMLTPREGKALEEMTWGQFFYCLSKMTLFFVALIVMSVFLQKYVTPYAVRYFSQFN